MAGPPIVDPVAEAHETARTLARTRTFDSIKAALVPTAWAVGLTAVITGSLFAGQKLGVAPMLAWIIGGGLAFGLVSFATVEITRLAECARALRALVGAHIYYESLIATARDERDRAVVRAERLAAERAGLETAFATLSGITLALKGHTGDRDGEA